MSTYIYNGGVVQPTYDSLGNKITGIVNPDGTTTGITPVTITGNRTWGSTLTASLSEGWSVSGFQWVRDGVDISGATLSTYTLVTADIGKTITVRVTGLTFTGRESLKVAYDGPPLLRVASPYNRSATELVSTSSGVRRVAARLYRPIGSANKKTVGVRLDNWYFSSATNIAGAGVAVTVIAAFVECNGVSVRLTFSGNPTTTLASGDFDKLSDLLPASAFGLSQINRGTALRVRIEVEGAAGGGIPVAGALDLLDQCRQYDPAVASCNNLSGTGTLTFTGTTTATTVPFVTLIGEDVDTAADARCWIGNGDSIFWQSEPQSYFMKALEGNNTASGLISGVVLGRSGGTNIVVNNHPNEIGSFAKYANGLMDNYGTNDIPGTANNTIVTRARSNWAIYKARVSTHPLSRAMVIIRTPLLMKTTGTFTTLAGQTITSSWNANAAADQLNDLMLAQVGIPGGVDVFADNLTVSPNVIRGSASGKGTTGSDYYKWAANTTTDGTHPNGTGASGTTGLGANARVYLLANA